jgi:hypothetical protein
MTHTITNIQLSEARIAARQLRQALANQAHTPGQYNDRAVAQEIAIYIRVVSPVLVLELLDAYQGTSR